MGRDVAVFSYFHLLPERALMEPIFAAPVPPIEAKLVPVVYGLLSGLFTKLLKLSPENAAEAADQMRRDVRRHRSAASRTAAAISAATGSRSATSRCAPRARRCCCRAATAR